jgi:hypothetical protein
MLEKQSSMQKGNNVHANVIVEDFSIEKSQINSSYKGSLVDLLFSLLV